MHLLLTAYVLIQVVGLVYIPTDRETVIADSILILAYAASPLVLMGMLRPDGGTSRPWEESPRQATGIPSAGAQTPRPEAETQGP